MDETDVCNIALDMLRETPISSIDASGSVPEWFRRNFAVMRSATLRAYPWNMAVTRASLTADATAPSFGWLYRYALPTDCLRVLPIRTNGLLNGRPIFHEIEGRYILTDTEGPLKIRYIRDVSAVKDWEPLFVRAFAAQLALGISHWLTGKASFVQMAKAVYDEALAEARRIDAQEGTPESVDADDVIAVRYAR